MENSATGTASNRGENRIGVEKVDLVHDEVDIGGGGVWEGEEVGRVGAREDGEVDGGVAVLEEGLDYM